MSIDMRTRELTDPDLEGQHLSARRALRELERMRMVCFSDADGNQRQVVARPSPFQAEILAALGVDTSTWRFTRRLMTAITRCRAKTASPRPREQAFQS